MLDDDRGGDWDEHTSWIALLEDDNDLIPVDSFTLVDRLGPAFTANHHHGKEYIKNAFIPVLQHTKQLHEAIQSHVFPQRAHALALLDETALHFERVGHRDMTTAQTAYENTKRSLDVLFSSLDDLVRQSDLLFQDFKTGMREHVQRLRHCTNQIPVDAERLIAQIDKKAKHLGAEDHAKAKENFLRGILEKY